MEHQKPAPAVVWTGVVGVLPREGCDLLSPQEGAFVNFLTLAASESEYRAKVMGALSDYRLELVELQDVCPLSESDSPNDEILALAAELAELEVSRNEKHVRYATFHTFPRVM